MAEILTPDLCVVGAGAGGVAAACAAAVAGAEVVIVEPRQFDDSYSDAALFAHVLIERARKIAARRSDLPPAAVDVDTAAELSAVRARVEKLAARVARDTPARLAALNVKMIKAAGRFTSEKRLEAGTAIIEAKWFVIATGAVPTPQPAIKGISLAPPLAPADLVDLETWPKRLILAGDDGQAVALAQACRRLGSDVHLLSRGDLLPQEDRELVAPIQGRLLSEGVSLHPQCAIIRLEPQGSGCMVEALEGGAPLRLEAARLVMFAPPVARTEGLGLAEAGVDCDKDAIKVRDDLRTSNPRIYAIGDVIGSTRSYAKARYQAHQVIGQLFDSAARRPAPSPRLVFTDPELAVVGLTEAEAQAAGHDIRVLRAGFRDNVAAHLAGESEGHVKIITDAQDRLLGAGIVGGQARELIGIFGFALSLRLRAADLKGFIPASPSLTEASRAAVLASPLQFGKTLWRRIFPMPRRFK